MLAESIRRLVCIVLLTGLTMSPAGAQTPVNSALHITGHRLLPIGSRPVDANLYTTYSSPAPYTFLSWVRCGSTARAEGCFDSGELSGFSRICAMIDGAPIRVGDVVTHDLYVLDGGATSSDTARLLIYRFVDRVTASYDTTTVIQVKAIDLSLQGGASACSMAANADYVYVGTNASDYAVSVSKLLYLTTELAGFSAAVPVTQITADDRGYVIVQFGSGNSSGFYMYAPDGVEVEDGGGTALLPNTHTGSVFP